MKQEQARQPVERRVEQTAIPHPAVEEWNGETYYGQASVKPSPFDWRVAAYVYVAGLAGSAQIIATLADRLGDERDETTIRNGRLLAVAGVAIGAPLLIMDLKTPSRFYNMLRIYRTSSPMSFGSYILGAFGAASGLTAVAHLIGERRADGGRSPMRRAADMTQVPAAFLGAGMSTYTAALLSATSTPLWASAPQAMAAQFGTSSMATAAAALSLGEQIAGNADNSRRLDGLAAVAAAGELIATAFAEKRHRETGVGATLRDGPIGMSYKTGALALGLGVPLVCHSINALSKRPSRGLSILGSLALLAGGMVMRQAIFQAGNKSAERPDDYFRLTQRLPEGQSRAAASTVPSMRGATAMIDRQGCDKALETLDRVLDEKPEQYHEEVVEVLRCLVSIRNHLIARRRSEPSGDLDERLDHANVVISVMTSGSFPVVGLNHERLKQARDLMASILDTLQPDAKANQPSSPDLPGRAWPILLHDPTDPHPPPEPTRSRAGAAKAVAAALPVLASCSGPQSTFTAAGSESESILHLFYVMLAGASVIWLFVIGLSLYAVRSTPARDGARIGVRLIVWGGCVFPTVVLALLLYWGLEKMPGYRRPADGPRIAVSGERFWWRVAYDVEGEPGIVKSLPTGGVESANEIWIPVGRRTEILLGSPDVIHSFWVPALAGKTDMIPGRVNRIVLEPLVAGVYNGVCAEFCGDAHAQMGLRVVAVPEAEYAAHVAAMAEPAAVVSGRGVDAFLGNGCAACHTVRGTPAAGSVGPDLTHVASRLTLGAGLLENNRENLTAFIRATDHVKPGVQMPAFGMLPDDDIAVIANWLGELR